MLSKEEFEKGYCERSDITLEEYLKHKITLPCSCGSIICEGWAAISRTLDSIYIHMLCDSPDRKELTDDEIMKLIKNG